MSDPLITTYPSGLVSLRIKTVDDSHNMRVVTRPKSVLHYTTYVTEKDACIYIHSTTDKRQAYSQCYDMKDPVKLNEYEAALSTLNTVLCSGK
jgi:hypothetical protein